MTGKDDDYCLKVKEILENAEKDVSIIHTRSENGTSVLSYTNKWDRIDFFSVKLAGRLRYISLYTPLKLIHSEFVCTMETLTKGENYCRIYVPSPDALDSISQYIIDAFERAQDEYNHHAQTNF